MLDGQWHGILQKMTGSGLAGQRLEMYKKLPTLLDGKKAFDQAHLGSMKPKGVVLSSAMLLLPSELCCCCYWCCVVAATGAVLLLSLTAADSVCMHCGLFAARNLAGLAHTSFQGFQECNSQTSPWQRTKSKRQAQLDYTSSQALPSLNSKSSTKVKICTP
eukprot:1159648-Pelagomonas_calceolata.AAC.3